MRIKIKKSRKEKKSQTNWPAPYRWAAMGTLAVYSAAGSKFVPAALAQSQPAQTAPLSTRAEGRAVRRFDIPAGPLEQAVQAFEQATGWTVTLSAEGMRALDSPGVTGS